MERPIEFDDELRTPALLPLARHRHLRRSASCRLRIEPPEMIAEPVFLAGREPAPRLPKGHDVVAPLGARGQLDQHDFTGAPAPAGRHPGGRALVVLGLEILEQREVTLRLQEAEPYGVDCRERGDLLLPWILQWPVKSFTVLQRDGERVAVVD